MELHALMRGHEAQALVEAPGVRPRLVDGELHQVAAALACPRDGPLEERASEAARALARVDPHALDLGAPAALVGERGHEGELEDPDHRRVAAGDHQLVVGVAVDGGEGLQIGRRQRRRVALAGAAQRIVGEQADDRGHVLGLRAAEHRGGVSAGQPRQPAGLCTRVAEAGNFASLSAGRRGRGTNSPPQLGQRPWSTVSAQARQNVHSNEHTRAWSESGGRSRSQHSQPGRSSSMGLPPRWATEYHLEPEEETMAKSAVTAERFAKGMTFDEYVTYAGSPQNLAREAFGSYYPDGGAMGIPRKDNSAVLRERYGRTRLADYQVAAI